MAKNEIAVVFKEKLQRFETELFPIINANKISKEIQEEISLEDMSREELEIRYIRAITSVHLYQEGYRSIIKGQGYFAHPQKISKPEYIARIYNSSIIEEKKKAQIVKKLQHTILNDSHLSGQLEFDITGQIKEHLTTEELLEIIRAEEEAV